MQFRLINDIRCVNLEEVGEFLKYKNIKAFITRISKKTEIIEDKYVEISKFIMIIRKSVREGIEELLDILLGNKHKEQIQELRKEVIEHHSKVIRDIYNKNISIFFKDIHTILSSYKVEYISEKECLGMLYLYGYADISSACREMWDIYEDSLPLSKEDVIFNKSQELTDEQFLNCYLKMEV